MVSPQDIIGAVFQNTAHYFQHAHSDCIAATDILQHDFNGQHVAIIGINQHSVSHLEHVCHFAESVSVFQIYPRFVLPRSERATQRLIDHPLVIKNRRLFNKHIKNVLALRFLDAEVKDRWLKRELTPNSAKLEQDYLKSDSYYAALQRENCHLITWPIVKIQNNHIHSLEGTEHAFDVIITTY